MPLLIVPDSAHMQCTPITLGTLHINMAIKLATKTNLRISISNGREAQLLRDWSMKEMQVVDVEEVQIVLQLDSSVKLAKDIIVGPFETVET